MAWTATLKSVSKFAGIATITMTFSDGNESFEKSYRLGSLGDNFVAKQAAQELRNLEDLDAKIADLKASIGQLIVPFDPTPTPEQKAANDFFALVAKLNALKASVAKGTTPPDDPDIVSLTAAIKDTLNDHPEYLTDPRWR